ELSAVHEAQKILMTDEDQESFAHYYCVGYSILYYELDGEPIGSLIDQQGEEATIKVIATFLPKIVVESLLASLQRAGLQMKALTLEPIAAIHVLIPESMRRLNVALIDIGAGTSDIAVTKDGTIIAYGMVPLAGDKITEALSDTYILDFPDAEQAKKDIVLQGETTIQDILGIETLVNLEHLLNHTKQDIESMATTLAHEILTLNGKAPQAIMLIGGGSLTPMLPQLLAEKVGLSEQRVAVRGVEAVQKIQVPDTFPTGPDYVTPIGIAILSKQNPKNYMHVTVNNQSLRMFEMKELTVGDALIQAGIELTSLFGKPGLALFITVNEKRVTLPGHLGSAPTIYVNGQEAIIETVLQQDDEIVVEKGIDGTSPQMSPHEFIGDISSLIIYCNDKPYNLQPRIRINGTEKDPSTIIQDHDDITIDHISTLSQFLISIGKEQAEEMFTVYVNKKPVHITKGRKQIRVNNHKVAPSYILQENDRITVQPAEKIRIQDVCKQISVEPFQKIDITFGDEPIQLSKQIVEFMRGDTMLSLEDVIEHNTSVAMKEKKYEPFIFQDVFRYVDIDLSSKSGSFTLLKNDQKATFFEPLSDGDHVQITWSK